MSRPLLLRAFLEHIEKETGCVGELEYRFHPVRRWRFDMAFPEPKVAVEIEGGVWTGGRHVRGKGFRKDCEKYNTAAAMGWRVLRTPWDWMEDWSMFDVIVDAIRCEK
jgi:very-short-patch-repair endonuclease